MDKKGKPKRFRTRAYSRDFDGVSRMVETSGRTATMASHNLRMKLRDRTLAGRCGDLTAMSRFSDAHVKGSGQELWSGGAVGLP